MKGWRFERDAEDATHRSIISRLIRDDDRLIERGDERDGQHQVIAVFLQIHLQYDVKQLAQDPRRGAATQQYDFVMR